MQVGARAVQGARAALHPAQAHAPTNGGPDTRAAHELKLAEVLAEDFKVYEGQLSEPGLWAVVAHRLGTHGTTTDSLITNAVLGTAHKLLTTGVDLVWGIDLPRSVQLGRRVRLWHNGCMSLHARSIGDDVHIRHDTTLGPLRVRGSDANQLPVIEARAELGSGVCVLGNVNVGHDAMVGANSLVIKNVPPKVTVMGVPARILPS